VARVILDTGALVNATRRRLDLASLIAQDDIALPAIALTEYLAGVELDPDESRRAVQRAFLDAILTVTPVKQASAVLNYQNSPWRTSIAGSTQDYLAAFHRTMSAGSFFSESDLRTSARVVVLGDKPVQKLFGGFRTAALGYLDDVIDPRETRPLLAHYLKLCEGKKVERPWRKREIAPV